MSADTEVKREDVIQKMLSTIDALLDQIMTTDEEPALQRERAQSVASLSGAYQGIGGDIRN